MKSLRLVLCIVACLAWTGPAQAAMVAIVWPPTPSAEVTQALTLLRGELLSVGVEVTRAERARARGAAEADSVGWLGTFATKGASAVIEAVGDNALEAIDVWVLKTRPQRFEVTRVAVEPHAPRQPEMLALRAVEALRAGLLQIDWAARKRGREPLEEPPATNEVVVEAHAPERREGRVALEAGVVGILGLDGLGPAVSPTVRLGWAARPWLVLHATAAGLGSRSAVTTTKGNAKVGQQYAVLGGFCRLRPTKRLWPFFGLAAGVLHTTVEGQGAGGTSGQTAERWSGLMDMGLGAGLRLYGRTYATLSAHAQVAAPYVSIHILDSIGATSGRPNLLLALAVGAWL